MRDAVIVSTARTPIGKAFRGAFNMTHGVTLTAHAIEHTVKRAAVDRGEVEDVVVGCGFPEGATGFNHARGAALRAGLPVTTAATTINRYCSSGLQAISVAAHRVIVDKVPVMVAGGIEQISIVSPGYHTNNRDEAWLLERHPDRHMPMIDTCPCRKPHPGWPEAADRVICLYVGFPEAADGSIDRNVQAKSEAQG